MREKQTKAKQAKAIKQLQKEVSRRRQHADSRSGSVNARMRNNTDFFKTHARKRLTKDVYNEILNKAKAKTKQSEKTIEC